MTFAVMDFGIPQRHVMTKSREMGKDVRQIVNLYFPAGIALEARRHQRTLAHFHAEMVSLSPLQKNAMMVTKSILMGAHQLVKFFMVGLALLSTPVV